MNQDVNQTGKPRRKALWASAAIIALAATGIVGAKTYYETKVTELLAATGASAQSVDVDFLGQLHIKDLTLPLTDGKAIKVAAIDGRPKLPLIGGTLDIQNLDIDGAMGKLSIAQASIENAAFEQATRVEGQGDADTFARRLERFAATRIFAPEVIVTQSVAKTEQKTTYNNVTLLDILNGQIASYSADKSSFDITMSLPTGENQTEDKQITGSSGAISGETFDAAYAARLYTEKAGPQDTDEKLVYGPLSVKNISVIEGDARLSYDEIRSNGFTARMSSEPLLDTIQALTDLEPKGNPSPEEVRAILSKVMSVMNLIGKGDVQLLGFKADFPASPQTAPNRRVNLTIDRMDMQIERQKFNFGMNGLVLKNGEDSVELAEAGLDGFAWDTTTEAVQQFIALEGNQTESFDYRRFIPELGKFSIRGLNVDVATQDTAAVAAGTLPERVQFTSKNFELGLKKPFNGIPTDIEYRQEELSIPVPENSTDEQFIAARAMGFEHLVLSYAVSAGWDEPNKSVNIREISFSGKDIGTINLSGMVNGFTEEFFAQDQSRVQAALFGLSARELSLMLRDEGLMAKAIKLYSLQNNTSEAQVRAVLTMAVGFLAQQVAAEHPKLQEAADALVRFVTTPGTLNMNVKSTSDLGIGFVDMIAASQNPMGLLDKLQITATAK